MCDQLYFLCLSKVWSMLRHGIVDRVQNKECYFMCSPFLTFLLFFIMKFVFLSFPHICLINYQICNRILTNQKYELFCIYLFRNLVRYFFIKLAKAGFTSDKCIVFTTSINLFELNPFAKNCFIVLQNVLLSLTFLTQTFCKIPLFLKGFF